MNDQVRARKYALYLLTDMDRTEHQLREKLEKKKYAPELVEDTLAYVRSFGYLDDEKYIRHYEERMSDRKSRLRIRYDLIRKGIDKDQLDEVLQEIGERDERPLIRSLAARKLSTLGRDDEGRMRKTAAYLSRQGFRSEDIRAVLADPSLTDITKKDILK